MKRPRVPFKPFNVWFEHNKDDILELYNQVIIKRINCDLMIFSQYIYNHSL